MKVKFVLLVPFLVFTLVGCRTSDIREFEETVETFYQEIEHGYNFLIEQYFEDTITNYTYVEKRIEQGETLKSYTHIQSKQLELYGENKFMLEEIIYYFHSGEQLLVETDQSFEKETMSYENYMKLDNLIVFNLEASMLESYKVIRDDVSRLEAKLYPERVKDLINVDIEDVQSASLVIEIQGNNLNYIELVIEQSLSKMIIVIQQYTKSTTVLIPEVE